MDRAKFYAYLRRRDVGMFGTSLSQDQVEGLEAIMDECHRREADLGQTAYILATAYGETGGKMQPRRENMNYSAKRARQVFPRKFRSVAHAREYTGDQRRFANKVYNGKLGNRVGTDDGWDYRGAGIGQITGRSNFLKWGELMGIDLVGDPDQLMDLDVSVRALVKPMLEGWATGHKLPLYVNGDARNYRDARRVWNGTFMAEEYAGYARVFERALTEARWGVLEPPKADWAPDPTEAPQGLWAAIVAALMGLFGRK